MAAAESAKRKTTVVETPSPQEYNKINMSDSSDESETLSDTGMIFTEEARKAISMEGKSDHQLLELIC